jgi:hypothetical protein
MSLPRTEVEGVRRGVNGAQRDAESHNPSYPAREHFHEKAELEKLLQFWDERIRSARQTLSALGSHTKRESFTRLFHQMQGASDQLAESVRRLPLETGGLYDDDRERFKQAIAALERLWKTWEQAGD